ncbi:MAG TPA: hypothetical protein VFI78_05555 [Salinimicrobium sp.]|nr:hypothetical protein [Salinimicrobium sp.]
MIKRIFVVLVITMGTFSLNSCRDTVEKKTVIREVDREDEPDVDINVEEEEEEGIIERAGEEIDQEVNEEINEEIEKIGDDQ